MEITKASDERRIIIGEDVCTQGGLVAAYMYYKCLDTASDFGVHSSCHTEDRSLNRSQRTAAKSRTATATAGVVANAFLRNKKGKPNCHLK